MIRLACAIAEMSIIEPPRIARDAERRANGSGRAIAALGFFLSKRESRAAGLRERAGAGGTSGVFVVPVAADESDTALASSEPDAGTPAPARCITADGGNKR